MNVELDLEMDHKAKHVTMESYSPVSFEVIWRSNGLPNTVKKVYFLDPYTVVHFDDGTLEVVKTKHGDTFDKEVGLAMALMKKQFGNRSKFKNFIENDCVDQNSGK